MRFVKSNSMKPFIWMLSFVASLQPLLASECNCPCRARRVARPNDESAKRTLPETRACCGQHCGRSADSKRNNNRCPTNALAKLIGFSPCDCPSDCECQGRHWAGSNVV